MSCDLIIPNDYYLHDLADESAVSSGHQSSTEDGDSTSDSPVHLGKDCDQDKDSGIEFCGEDILQPLEGLTPPDKDLIQGIVDMVEYYFSDASLLKDTFLLKHVRRNKEGYVSLKLISNFRKVKTLTRDWRIVAYSLKHSKLMQVNEQCTKVRRVSPLPSHDETQSSRTVLVTSLTPGGEGGALEVASRCGDIVFVKLVKPSDQATDQHKDLKKFLSRRPELETCPFYLVEFSRQESASRAIAEINGTAFAAYALSDKSPAKPQAPLNNNNKQPAKKSRKGAKKQPVSRPADSSDSEQQCSPEVRRRSGSSVSSGYYSSSPKDYFERRTVSGRSSSVSVTRPAVVVRPRTRLDSAPVSGLSAEASPWVQRRLAGALMTPRAQSGVVVLREPRGPDGTKGFQVPRIAVTA